MRRFLAFFLFAVLAFADTFKLYLRDGNYHLVREYKVEGDRVRYYSTERSDWEEIPLALVDLNRTEDERKAKDERMEEEKRATEEEETAERDFRREIASIPRDSGTYYKEGDTVKAVPLADYKVVTNKTRKVVAILSPVPLIPGKASVVIDGAHSQFVVHQDRPAFYLRLAKEERFGIIKLESKKNARIVENIAIIPVSKENVEERKQLDTFDQQLGEDLYKVWPEKPLTPGEYALVQYSEGDVDLIIWDFAYRPAS